MYPIKFESLYYERIWGGRELEKFRTDVPDGNIGESWDIACHKNGIGIVANGEFKGTSFKELIESNGEKIIGRKIDKEKFPLLIKIINAKDKLSVQVHPDDEYAEKVEKDLGKTEAWYIIDAKEGASLVMGTKECNKENFREALEKGELDKYLNVIPVKKGEFYYVKSGLVHAICEGVTVAEIQQSSDTTYRVYDYNRGREIHIDRALDVIDFNLKSEDVKGITYNEDGYDKIILCLSEFFTIQKYVVKTKVVEYSDKDRFYLFTCVDGEGKIKSLEYELEIKFGDSILIPAYLGKYVLEGKFTLLKSYVPDFDKEKKEILGRVIK
ncbi:type I phosphomannose isomerase catalytic subunit [Clostridium cibarium]|uniref:Phosphohexomutase n=1 Tax=Clostridium cibarium TaxID=2762247 RepID=A0ABR8PT52_9CLOT|nr:type I phosphomannose isomerase catalytic subunit [Clostridium cibarium]MBD7911333.1 class I mannose-6-phosphate isomerase [Clostridium cibarium]